MGITIAYRGRLADLARIEDFEDRLLDLALELGGLAQIWRSQAHDAPLLGPTLAGPVPTWPLHVPYRASASPRVSTRSLPQGQSLGPEGRSVSWPGKKGYPAWVNGFPPWERPVSLRSCETG